MRLIALTGGIGAGKSTVASRFSELGAVVVDADVMARRAVEPGTPALNKLVTTFGDQILRSDGSLNRPKLGALIFSDPSLRLRAEAIIHPAVHELTQSEIRRVTSLDPDAIVVYDVPLLVESANPYTFDHVIVVSAPEDLRIQRLVDIRGMSRDEAAHRVASQASEPERLAVADSVIDSSGSLEQTFAQVDELWAHLKKSA